MDASTQQISRFTDIEINGFRGLKNVSIQMRPFCAMIGANGAGKTSFLDALWLLANSAQGRLNDSLSELGGLTSILTYGGNDELALSISKEVTGYQPLKYSLKLNPGGTGYRIGSESLTQLRTGFKEPFLHIQAIQAQIQYFDPERKLVRPNWEYNTLETALAQVPKMFQDPEVFRNRLASSTFYHVLNVGPRSPVRLPQPMQPAKLPGRDGEELVSCLYTLRESERSRFEAVEDALRSAFPAFERLDFPPVAAGTIALAWRDKRYSRPFYMHQLSEGTLRFLWIVTLLQSPGLTAMTMLDEPEVSLHPELLSILSELMREASKRTQLVIATHSDRLVGFLKPEEVLCLDSQEDGSTAATWGDDLDLKSWLEEYSLDELWRMGLMGARS